MNYLTHEISVWQAESQRLDASAAQLLAKAAQQDQVASAANARAAAARADATRLNNEASGLQSQASAADAQAASFDQQITQLTQNEPDKRIEIGDGKFKPNPEWATWKAHLDSLTAQRNQARTTASALRSQASQRSASAAQSQTAAAAADHDAAVANAAAAQLRQQATQLGAQKNAITQQIANINRWQQEIARQPMDRSALETTARELFAQIASLDDEYKSYGDEANAAEKKQWYVQTLIQELNSKIADLQGQLVAAATELSQATAAVNDVQTRIHHVLQRKPE